MGFIQKRQRSSLIEKIYRRIAVRLYSFIQITCLMWLLMARIFFALQSTGLLGQNRLKRFRTPTIVF